MTYHSGDETAWNNRDPGCYENTPTESTDWTLDGCRTLNAWSLDSVQSSSMLLYHPWVGLPGADAFVTVNWDNHTERCVGQFDRRVDRKHGGIFLSGVPYIACVYVVVHPPGWFGPDVRIDAYPYKVRGKPLGAATPSRAGGDLYGCREMNPGRERPLSAATPSQAGEDVNDRRKRHSGHPKSVPMWLTAFSVIFPPCCRETCHIQPLLKNPTPMIISGCV